MEKSWNFSTAYSESRIRNSDNSIFIGYCSVLAMADFQFIYIYINLRRSRDGLRSCVRVEFGFIQFALGSFYAVHINALSI